MRRSSIRKSSMATRWSPGDDECGAPLLHRMLRRGGGRYVGMKDEIEQRGEVGSRDDHYRRALALEPSRRHGAASGRKVAEDDLERPGVDVLPHRAFDVGRAHVTVGQGDERAAEARNLTDRRHEAGGEVAVAGHEGADAAALVTHRLPPDTA